MAKKKKQKKKKLYTLSGSGGEEGGSLPIRKWGTSKRGIVKTLFRIVGRVGGGTRRAGGGKGGGTNTFLFVGKIY